MKFSGLIRRDKESSLLKRYNRFREKKSRRYLCHAPFKSLTFYLEGNILACWHNKQFVLGKYPHDNIHDLWFGANLKKLREHILQNDLSCGCTECKNQLKNQNFSSVGAWKYDYLSNWESEYPVSMDFQISNTCNLECVMCNGEYSSAIRHNREKAEQYPNPWDEKLASQLVPFIPHLREASFSGGEVFMIQEYFEIWEKFIELNPGIRVSVTTNGTVLNERAKRILEKLKFNINFSIESVRKETYEAIRRNAGFEATMANLEYFEDYCKRKGTTLSARICPIRQNWQEVPELFTFLSAKNISLYYNTVIFPPSATIWNLDPKKISEIIAFLERMQFTPETEKQKQNYHHYSAYISQLKSWAKASEERERLCPGIENYGSSELRTILSGQIRSYIAKTFSFSEDEKERFLKHFDLTMDTCFEKIESESTLADGLRHFIGIPANRLVDEFNIRSVEKIVNLVRQS